MSDGDGFSWADGGIVALLVVLIVLVAVLLWGLRAGKFPGRDPSARGGGGGPSDPDGGSGPSATGVVSVLVAGGLLMVFMVTVAYALTKTLDPPLQADPAPDAPPQLICVRTGAPTGTVTPTATGTPTASAARTPSQRRSPASREQGQRERTRAASPSGSQVLTVECPGGEIQFAPQTRGAYDPAERLIGLLAIVVPLITTIVAFFFGARAGAGEGRSEAARARRGEAEILGRVRAEGGDLYDKLKKEGRI